MMRKLLMAEYGGGRWKAVWCLAVLVFVMAGQETGGSDAASGNTNESSDDADLGPVCPNSGLPEIDADCDIDSENRTITCRVNTTTLVEPRHHCNKSYGCLLHFHLHQGHWTYISHCFKDPKRENCHFIPSSSIDKGFPPMNGFRCHCGEHCPTLEDPLHYTHPHEPILVSDSIPSPAPSPSSNNTDVESNGRQLAVGVATGVIALVIVVIGLVLVILLYCCWHKFKQSSRHLSRHTRRSSILNFTSEHPPFTLNHLVSRGRYGNVYRTEYEGELVAVKIFTNQNRVSWENERTLFGMQSTRHRNVIDYIVAGMWGSGQQLQMFIVTPFFPLGSLNRFLARNSVSWEQACRVIHSIASGLTHLHGESYVDSTGMSVEKYAVAHRDIKSANVLVRGENGDCVISDLGFAMILDPMKDEKEIANTGQVGTYRYMAPEVLDARISLQDAQAFKQIDIYSLGLVMWEVVWRCNVQEEEGPRKYMMAYEDTAGQRTGIDTMRDIVCTQKIRPRILPVWRNHPGLSTLATTIEECWDEDPEARLSASNVILRLKELLDGGPTTFGGDRTPSHGFSHPSVVPGNEPYRMTTEVLLESTTDTIGTTDSRPPPYDSRWSYIPAAPAGDADPDDEPSVTMGLNIETTV